MASRTEYVKIEATSNLSTVAARDAAAMALLRKSLGDLDGTNLDVAQSTRTSSKAVDDQGTAFKRASPEIDKFSGRLRLIADAAAILGPSLVPIGAVAIPAVTGLAASLGFAALGAGTVAVAFQGVGDALTAVNDYALEPTTANFEKAQAAMKGLAPEAQAFVLRLRDMGPALREVRDATAGALFPGLTASLDDFEAVLPRVESIFVAVAGAAGDFAQETAASFNSDRWTPFLDFLAAEAPSALAELGRTVGAFTHGLAEMWMAFTPLNNDFSGWLLEQAQAFDEFSAGLSTSDGFAAFADYIQANGPRVAEALGAVGSAVVQIITALAPLGGPSLQIIETFADVIGAIAGSDIGGPLLAGAGALAAYNRMLAVTVALQTKMSASGGLFGGMASQTKTAAAGFSITAGGIAKTSAALGGLALATSDVGDKFALTNTAAGALMGSMLGPWGAAIGGAAGFATDLASANDQLAASMARVDQSRASGSIEDMRSAYDGLRESIGNASFMADFTGATSAAEAKAASLAAELRNLEAGGKSGADALAYLLTPTTQLGSAMSVAAQSVDEFAGSFARLNGLLNARDALIAYNQSMKALRDSIRSNGNAWDSMSAKGQANNQALNDSARSVEAYANTLKEAGRDQAASAFLRDSIQSFRQIGDQSAAAAKRVQPIIRALKEAGGIEANPKINLETGEFEKKSNKSRSELRALDKAKATAEALLNSSPLEQKMRAASGQLNNLDRQKPTPTADLNKAPLEGKQAAAMRALGLMDGFTATPTANLQDNASSRLSSIFSQMASLDGKTSTTFVNTVMTTIRRIVPGRADGGFITGPGGPRDDAIPTMLSNGEYVINAAATARNRSLLDQINAQKFADGGYVRPQPVPASAVPWRSSATARQSVSVGFDGPAEVLVRMPDGSTQVAQMRAVARQEINAADRYDKEWADR